MVKTMMVMEILTLKTLIANKFKNGEVLNNKGPQCLKHPGLLLYRHLSYSFVRSSSEAQAEEQNMIKINGHRN